MAAGSEAIDAIDRRILDVLRDSGRISWRELGERVHLAATSAADRVRRLERLGIIEGYSARIDRSRLGRDVRALIDVSLAPGDHAEAFEQRLTERPEVVFVAYVTGSADYIVIVECDGAEGLDNVVRWLRGDAAVARTESKLILRNVAVPPRPS